MNHDVFISYSTQDKETADKVCVTLEANQVSCWMAPRDIQPGADYAGSIIDAIETSKVFVLILSGRSNESKHVMREVERAVNKDILIIPFRIEDVVLSKALEYLISTHQWMDALRPPVEKHAEKMALVIRDIIRSMESGHDPDLVSPLEKPDKDLPDGLSKPVFKEGPPPGKPKRAYLAPAAILLILVVAFLAYRFYPVRPGPTPTPTTTGEALDESTPEDVRASLLKLAREADDRIEVSLNKDQVRIGEKIIITCQVKTTGYLNVFTMAEGDEDATVLFPNQYSQDNKVEEGQVVTIPPPGEAFELRAQPPAGRSLVVVLLTKRDVNAYRDGLGDPEAFFKTVSLGVTRSIGVVAGDGKYLAGRAEINIQE